MTSTQVRTAPGGSRFRADIEGLRAIAVCVVLLHHAGLAFAGGGFTGVDIFFVVSGFVITTQLLREYEEHGRINLAQFYARRAKRLLPAAALVLVVTTVAAALLVSRVQWKAIATDIVGAAAYVVNWVFADRAVDYMAEGVAPSPVLHYWSLAVEEQFYFIWPLVMLGLAALVPRHLDRSATRIALAAGLSLVIVVPSLLWAFWMTADQPEQAFFVTTTRLWELGVGALVAIGAPWWQRLRPTIANAVAWVGMLLIVLGLTIVDKSTPWPAPGALLPTLGTAAVIVGGFNATRGPSGVLGVRPMVWLGALSYSLYLWHWPVLRAAEWHWGSFTPLTGLLLVVASILPAWLCYRLVESPIRHSSAISTSPRLALSLGVNCTLAAVVAGLVLHVAVTTQPPTASSLTDPTASELRGEATEPAEPAAESDLFDVITPDPVNAVLDAPDLYQNGCHVEVYDNDVKQCDSGASDSDFLVAVVGDSKVAQWMPAIDAIAEENGWRVRIYTKGGCTFTDTMTLVDSEPFEQCRAWGQEVFDRLLEADSQPDVVVTSGLRKSALDTDGNDSVHGLVNGYVSYWRALSQQGTKVIAVSDTPSPDPSIGPNAYECVAEHDVTEVDAACSWEFKDMSSNTAMREAAELVDGAAFIDMNPYVCPDAICHAVWRNVLTYRQGSHITATYVMTLAGELARHLVPLVRDHMDAP